MSKNIRIKVILIVASCQLFFVVLFNQKTVQLSLSDEEKSTQKMLTDLESKWSVDDVYTQIHQIEEDSKKWSSIQNENKNDLNSRFKNALILGDSIAEGLIDYHVISPANCIGKRGARSDNVDDMHDAIKRKRPQIIFLEFGMNDLQYCRGREELFYKRYSEQLKELKTIAPYAKIYINGILPIEKKAVAKTKAYAKYPEFNKMLKKICQENKIQFIDNRFILDHMKKKYEKDGIHPTYDYYEAWAKNMAEVAGL